MLLSGNAAHARTEDLVPGTLLVLAVQRPTVETFILLYAPKKRPF